VLNWVKNALSASFPTTTIRISRPAVVVEFASDTETWEVIPGFLKSSDPSGLYDIPGPASGWIDSAPTAHQKGKTVRGRSRWDLVGGPRSHIRDCLSRILRFPVAPQVARRKLETGQLRRRGIVPGRRGVGRGAPSRAYRVIT
jgi:hypothetical protein